MPSPSDEGAPWGASSSSASQGAPPPDAPPPSGPPRFAWFDGVLAGPRTDPATHRRFVDDLAACGLGKPDLELDGGRFSLLVDSTPLDGRRCNDAAKEAFVERISELLSLLPPAGDVQSTVRCTEVFDERTRETLFAVVGRQLKPMSRFRATAPQDVARAPASGLPAAVVNLSRKKLALIAVLALAAFAAAAWQGGWIDRVFAAKAESLKVETGPFADVLSVELNRKLGAYVVTLKRGPKFPATKDAVDAALAAAVSVADRAAVEAAANGGDVFVRLENRAGEVLERESVSLRPLLTSGDATVETKLMGRISAVTLRVALDAGK